MSLILEKPKCPRCGGVNLGKCGFAKDSLRRKWKCIDCGRIFVENPKIQWGKSKEVVYVPKKCIECGGELSLYYRRKVCAECLLKKASFCSKCGKPLAENNKSGICWGCKLEIVKREKQKRYVNLDVHYSEDGSPICIDCGCCMILDRGKWSCTNQLCSVISLSGREGAFKVARDSVMAGRISGNAVMLEVVS